MNKNRILYMPIVIFLFSFVFFFLSCGSHEEDHNHEKEIQKHTEQRSTENNHHEQHNDHGHSNKNACHTKVSSEKAVIKANETKGIQLLPEAMKTIGLKKLPLKKFEIPGAASYRLYPRILVRHKLNRSCYLKRGPWLIQTKVRVIKKNKGHVIVEIHRAENSDEIITAGVPLLHLAWLEAFGASGHGHGH